VALELRDYLLTDAGVEVSGWTVNLRTGRKTGAPGAILFSTTTDVNGMWEFVDGVAGVTLVAGTKYDVQAVSGTHQRWWRGYTAIPQEFGDLQIAAAAGILLTKLDDGPADDTVSIATTPTTLQGTINRIAAVLKRILGEAAYTTLPAVNLNATNTHIAGTGGSPSIHGLSTSASFIGESQGGGGYHFKWGNATTGSESSIGSPTIFTSTAAVTFNVAFPTSVVAVLITPNSGACWGSVASVTTSGFTGRISSTNSGFASTNFYWLALGH